MRPARASAKRCIFLDATPVPEGRKTFSDRVGEWFHGEVSHMTVEIDGVSACTLYVDTPDDPLRLDLDDKAHVIRLVHSALKPDYPTVTVPKGRGYYVYTADGSRKFQIRCVDSNPPIPPVDYVTAVTTGRILDYLVRGLQSGGELLGQLRSNQAVSFLWLECHEVGFAIHYFPNGDRNPPQSLEFDYDDFARAGDRNGYSALPTDQAVGLEYYLIRQLKWRLENAAELEFFVDNEYHCIRRKAKIAGSRTTQYICADMVDYWRPGKWLYDKLHQYDVREAVMAIDYDGVYVKFYGYPGEHKRLPADVELPYGHFHRPGGDDYHALNRDELAELADQIARAIGSRCEDDIVLRPVPNYEHAYTVLDLHKYENP